MNNLTIKVAALVAVWVTALRLFRQLGMEMQSQAVIKAMAA